MNQQVQRCSQLQRVYCQPCQRRLPTRTGRPRRPFPTPLIHPRREGPGNHRRKVRAPGRMDRREIRPGPTRSRRRGRRTRREKVGPGRATPMCMQIPYACPIDLYNILCRQCADGICVGLQSKHPKESPASGLPGCAWWGLTATNPTCAESATEDTRRKDGRGICRKLDSH